MYRRAGPWIVLFLTPALLLFCAFTLFPFAASIRYTLYKWNGSSPSMEYVGLGNYLRVLRDPLFWNAVRHTFAYTSVLVIVQTLLAFVLATLLNSQYALGSQVLRTIFFIPIATPAAVTAAVVSMLIVAGGTEFGTALVRLDLLGRPVDWLGDSRTALGVVTLVGTWLGFGYPLIYFLAALKMLDQEVLDAAKVDGANAGVLLWRITIPQLRPVLMVVVLMTTLHALRTFDTVQVLTRGGPFYATDLVGTYIFRRAFPNPADELSDSDIGLASAAALVMSLLTVGLAGLQYTIARAARNGQTKKVRS